MNIKEQLLSGDEALARGAYEAGLMTSAAYPGTPSTEITEYLAQFKEVKSEWSVNEKVAYEVALGSAVAGARSLYASKHVGINVAMDPLMTSVYMGVNGGFVVVTCDDPGLHSSQNEQDNRLVAPFAKMPLIEPSSPQEAKDFIKTAFDLSEQFDTPVLFRMTTRIAHTKENVTIGERKEVGKKPYTTNIEKNVMVPANAFKKHVILEKRLKDLQEYAEKTSMNTVEYNDKKFGFITSGVSYLYAKEKFPTASFLKLGMPYPFPEKLAREFAKNVDEVFVLEEQEPFIENMARLTGIACRGKHPSFLVGELRPEFIVDLVSGKEKQDTPTPVRKPVLCPGCPHRAVFTTLKKLKVNVNGDIGCYTLGAMPPLSALHTCVCMGASVTFLQGFKKAGETNSVAVIGDSTFVHSGITGLINQTYNKVPGVLIILDNGTTAMTGSQPHPATGKTLAGEDTPQLDLEKLCASCGADTVDIIDPFKIKDLEKLVKERMAEGKISVIIARSPCRLIEKRKKPMPKLDAKKCVKCYKCLEINCPALTKNEDGSIKHDTSLCVGCSLCSNVCAPKALHYE